MNVRSIKKRNTQRVRSWIPQGSGSPLNVVLITSSLQMVRMFGKPRDPAFDIKATAAFFTPPDEVYVVRVTETDLSEFV